jgi:hypothetical protein
MLYYFTLMTSMDLLDQWFSTGVLRKALGVLPISEFDWHLLVRCSMEFRQIAIN